MDHDEVPLTEEEISRLIKSVSNAKEFSYSPYSHFRVGCALLLQDGSIVQGCNVENVSYGLSICAERTAYTKAISDGKKSFRAVFVSTDVTDTFVWPCGACRQFMSEFDNVDIYAVNNNGNYEKRRLNELLPKSFDVIALEKGQNKTNE